MPRTPHRPQFPRTGHTKQEKAISSVQHEGCKLALATPSNGINSSPPPRTATTTLEANKGLSYSDDFTVGELEVFKDFAHRLNKI